MPKASINEHRNSFSHKNKIGAPCDLKMSPPPTDSMRPQKGDHHELSTTVTTRPHPRHNFRALRLAVDIAHLGESRGTVYEAKASVILSL